MPVFVDSNVFVYAAGAEHPLKGPCVALLRRIAAGEIEATTSVEVVQELHHLYRRRGQPTAGLELGRDVLRLFPDVLPITRADIERSTEILAATPRLSPRDALHVATALNHGMGQILSVDGDLDGIDGIRRVDPRDA